MGNNHNPEKSEFQAFSNLVGKVLTVPKAEILRRESEYQQKSELNPRRRGPKRKIKTSASLGPDASLI